MAFLSVCRKKKSYKNFRQTYSIKSCGQWAGAQWLCLLPTHWSEVELRPPQAHTCRLAGSRPIASERVQSTRARRRECTRPICRKTRGFSTSCEERFSMWRSSVVRKNISYCAADNGVGPFSSAMNTVLSPYKLHRLRPVEEGLLIILQIFLRHCKLYHPKCIGRLIKER